MFPKMPSIIDAIFTGKEWNMKDNEKNVPSSLQGWKMARKRTNPQQHTCSYEHQKQVLKIF